jgi:hypothetical protein
MDQFDERRESFAIQSTVVINELQQMIEKTKKIEAQLLQCGSPQVIPDEFYRPSFGSEDMQPPKKKTRFTK